MQCTGVGLLEDLPMVDNTDSARATVQMAQQLTDMSANGYLVST